jgi:hypothetical protein
MSADFSVDVTENWQREYLQFLTYLMAAVWLLQKGSPESKELDKAGRESQKDQRRSASRWSRTPRDGRGTPAARVCGCTPRRC